MGGGKLNTRGEGRERECMRGTGDGRRDRVVGRRMRGRRRGSDEEGRKREAEGAMKEEKTEGGANQSERIYRQGAWLRSLRNRRLSFLSHLRNGKTCDRDHRRTQYQAPLKHIQKKLFMARYEKHRRKRGQRLRVYGERILQG